VKPTENEPRANFSSNPDAIMEDVKEGVQEIPSMMEQHIPGAFLPQLAPQRLHHLEPESHRLNQERERESTERSVLERKVPEFNQEM
jgi:hypothetical protein